MYSFGDEKTNAHMWAMSLQWDYGPGPIDLHPDEMTSRQLRDAFVYAYGALSLATNQDHSVEFLEALEETYEDLLERYCKQSNIIREALKAGTHVFPWSREESILRQTAIIKASSAN